MLVVAFGSPTIRFSNHDSLTWDATIETLSIEHTEFDFGHI